MVGMNEARAFRNEAATGLAFAALQGAVGALSAAQAERGREENADLAACAKFDLEFFEQLAGLAHAGLRLVESNRDWFLTEGLPGSSHDFWYTLALTVMGGPLGRVDSPPPPPTLHEPIRVLYVSMLRFLPYACVQPGDCAVRIADALTILYTAFPLDGLHELTLSTFESASSFQRSASAVSGRVEERYRETRGPSQTAQGEPGA